MDVIRKQIRNLTPDEYAALVAQGAGHRAQQALHMGRDAIRAAEYSLCISQVWRMSSVAAEALPESQRLFVLVAGGPLFFAFEPCFMDQSVVTGCCPSTMLSVTFEVMHQPGARCPVDASQLNMPVSVRWRGARTGKMPTMDMESGDQADLLPVYRRWAIEEALRRSAL